MDADTVFAVFADDVHVFFVVYGYDAALAAYVVVEDFYVVLHVDVFKPFVLYSG